MWNNCHKTVSSGAAVLIHRWSTFSSYGVLPETGHIVCLQFIGKNVPEKMAVLFLKYCPNINVGGMESQDRMY